MLRDTQRDRRMKINPENMEDRRRSILDAAEQVFGERGYAQSTMDEVATLAGISKGSVYNYFKNKQELFGHLFSRAVGMHEDESTAILQSDSPASVKVEKIVDQWFEGFSRLQRIGRLMLEFWATAARAEQQQGELTGMFRRMYSHWRGQLAGVVEQAAKCGEFSAALKPQVAAALILAILDGIQVQSILDIGLVVDDEFVAALKRSILAGLRAPVDSTRTAI